MPHPDGFEHHAAAIAHTREELLALACPRRMLHLMQEEEVKRQQAAALRAVSEQLKKEEPMQWRRDSRKMRRLRRVRAKSRATAQRLTTLWTAKELVQRRKKQTLATTVAFWGQVFFK